MPKGLNALDLTGKRIGKLSVEGREPRDSRRTFWRCRCDCGTVCVKMGKYLSNGDTRSCGCDQRHYRATGRVIHGGILKGVKSREYRIWRSMKSRCLTPSSSNFRFYGGIGVAVCDRWKDDFAAFAADMGPCPAGYTLDRIDSAGHYEPSNCRWASWSLQHNNTRRTVYVDTKDGKQPLSYATRDRGVHHEYQRIRDRVVRRGMSFDDAVKSLGHLIA